MPQKALDVSYDKMVGTLHLDELKQWLEQGWTVNTIAESGGGDLLVIIDSPKQNS